MNRRKHVFTAVEKGWGAKIPFEAFFDNRSLIHMIEGSIFIWYIYRIDKCG